MQLTFAAQLPKLHSITINGERIPFAEAEIRSVQLYFISSDMIETIEFSKTTNIAETSIYAFSGTNIKHQDIKIGKI